jgi:hypothetical protein
VTPKSKKTAVTIALIVLVGLWISSEIRAYRAEMRLGAVRLGSVMFTVIDADTGQALSPRVQLPEVTSGSDYSPALSVEALNDLRLVVRYAALMPLELRVSSDGYQDEVVRVQAADASLVTVRLKRRVLPGSV